MNRSEYLGVYHNTGKGRDEVPFRVAIRLGNGSSARWVNCGYADPMW